MNGAQFLVQALKQQGVTQVFGYPGGAIMPVYDALYDGGLAHQLCRHEQGAAMAAVGYARASGQVGVCIATSGPGATNLVTGLAEALLDSVQPGIDNRDSVERTLGRPTFVSEFGRQDWYYISQNTKQAAFTRPRANEQMILRVRFDEKGNVAGIDRAGLEKVARLDPDGKKTPTLGRERTFIEDLFGNIGTVGTGAGGPGGGSPGGGPNGS